MVDVLVRRRRLHAGQQRVSQDPARFRICLFGRRWGKNALGVDEAMRAALAGQYVGWFEPTYKFFLESWRDLTTRLRPAAREIKEQERRIELLTGGVIEAWTCDTPDPGRSRRYHLVIINEAGLIRELRSIWQAAIRPTLTDFQGRALFLGTPKGAGHDFSVLYRQAQAPLWQTFTGATLDNPHIDPAEVAQARAELPPSVFAQEYEGVPAEDGGNPFGLDHIRICTVTDHAALQELTRVMPRAFGWDFARSQDFTVGIGIGDQYEVCRLHRWQGIDWGEQKARIHELNGATPAWGDATRSRVDDVIVQDLQRMGTPIQGVPSNYAVRQALMQRLQVAIHQHKLRIPDGPIARELESFGYQYTGRGVRYCLAPSSRVLMADLSWRAISDVVVGDELAGFDEMPTSQGRCWRKAIVIGTRILRRPCFRIALSDGSEVVASSDHQWLIDTGQGGLYWRETHRLRVRHDWSTSRRFMPTRVVRLLPIWEPKHTYAAGYLAAAFDGEGSLTQRHRSGRTEEQHTCRLAFSQRPNEMAAMVETLLTADGVEWSRHQGTGSAAILGIRGGIPAVLRMLSETRPRRLLAGFDIGKLGRMHVAATPKVEELEPLGMEEVVALTTSTRTFIAEGLASHNCAPENEHDDCVMALALAVYGRDQFGELPELAHAALYDENRHPGFDPGERRRIKPWEHGWEPTPPDLSFVPSEKLDPLSW